MATVCEPGMPKMTRTPASWRHCTSRSAPVIGRGLRVRLSPIVYSRRAEPRKRPVYAATPRRRDSTSYNALMNPPLMTAQQHILEEQRRLRPSASGEFSWLLSGITLATKIIADQVRRAGLVNVLGSAGQQNVQGETVQKLDVLANQALLQCLGNRGSVAVMASEEDAGPVVSQRDWENGTYVVVFDPLDGSSNIDVNVSVGTIFSILRRSPPPDRYRTPLEDVLQPGLKQVAAGYVVYGSSTMLVYTAGNGVNGFTLEPSIGAYLISHPNIRMP